jgi:hypothetical protein
MSDSHSAADIRDVVALLNLQMGKPLFWHDGNEPWPRHVRGATCFVIRFPGQLVGVTAAHVIREYRTELERTPRLVCQLALASIDPLAAIIDIDRDLDIATFAVSEQQLSAARAVAISCGDGWPPPDVKQGQPLCIIGYPEITRTVWADRTAEHGALGMLTTVDQVTDRDLVLVYDPQQAPMDPLSGLAPAPPVGLDMSGCSGGPAILHGMRRGLHRWFPIGVIVGGSGAHPEGEAREFDMIRIRRINCIRPDGTIERPSTGWLPGRTPPS